SRRHDPRKAIAPAEVPPRSSVTDRSLACQPVLGHRGDPSTPSIGHTGDPWISCDGAFRPQQSRIAGDEECRAPVRAGIDLSKTLGEAVAERIELAAGVRENTFTVVDGHEPASGQTSRNPAAEKRRSEKHAVRVQQLFEMV